MTATSPELLGPSHPFGLTVYKNYLYYTDWIKRALVKVNKLTGGEIEILRGNFTEQPMGVVVVAEDAQECQFLKSFTCKRLLAYDFISSLLVALNIILLILQKELFQAGMINARN